MVMKSIDPQKMIYFDDELRSYLIENNNILKITNRFCNVLLHENCELMKKITTTSFKWHIVVIQDFIIIFIGKYFVDCWLFISMRVNYEFGWWFFLWNGQQEGFYSYSCYPIYINNYGSVELLFINEDMGEPNNIIIGSISLFQTYPFDWLRISNVLVNSVDGRFKIRTLTITKNIPMKKNHHWRWIITLPISYKFL